MNQSLLIELHYLPSIQFITKLLQFPSIKIEQYETYQKGSYRNRCHIAGSHGVLPLSVPLKGGKNEQQPIREVRIAYDQPWKSQHWTAIRSAYGKSPYFDYYGEGLHRIFQQQYEFLFDWNWDLFQYLLSVLNLDTTIDQTERYEKKGTFDGIDFRDCISPKLHKAIRDDQFQPAKYVQVFEERNGFLPNLSILDLLFCTGPEAALILDRCIR